MTYSEVHKLPIRYRHWFLRRLVRHFDSKNKAIEKAQNSSPSPQNSKDNLDMFSRFENQVKNKLS